MELNYQKDKVIDINNLEAEIIRQSDLGVMYAEYYAKCLIQLRKAEEALKIIKADLTMEVLEDPSAIGLEKTPTGAMIEAYYRNHEKHKKAKELYMQAYEAKEYAEVGKKEICVTRKNMLSELVKLHGQSYFSSPEIPKTIKEINEQVEKKANKKVSKKLKRNK